MNGETMKPQARLAARFQSSIAALACYSHLIGDTFVCAMTSCRTFTVCDADAKDSSTS